MRHHFILQVAITVFDTIAATANREVRQACMTALILADASMQFERVVSLRNCGALAAQQCGWNDTFTQADLFDEAVSNRTTGLISRGHLFSSGRRFRQRRFSGWSGGAFSGTIDALFAARELISPVGGPFARTADGMFLCQVDSPAVTETCERSVSSTQSAILARAMQHAQRTSCSHYRAR